MTVSTKICGCCMNQATRLIKGMCPKCYAREYNKTHYVRRNLDRRKQSTLEIVSLSKSGVKQSVLADQFGVSKQRISKIIKEQKAKESIQNEAR